LPDGLKRAMFACDSALFRGRSWPFREPAPLPKDSLVPFASAKSDLPRRLFLRSSLFGLVLSLAATAPALAKARDNLAVPSPFEVGESPAGNYLAALVAGAERDTFAASTFFREALRADPKNSELLERAFVSSVANGNMPEAFGLAERLVQRDPNNGLAHLALGIRALKQHRWKAARADLNKGGSGVQRDLTGTLLVAWSYVGSGENDKALAQLDKLRDDAFKVFRDYHGALVADLMKNRAEARKRFVSLYNTDKGTLRLIDAYARFMASNGDRTSAKLAYQAFDDLLPRHPIVTSALADLDAGKPLEPFVRNADDGAAEVLYGLGAVGGRQGDELASMIYLRLSLYLAPNNGLALVTLADVLERLKQYETAIDIYNAVPDNSPLRTNADIQIALLLETLGKGDEASKQLRAIVAEHPKDEEALSALGNLQRSRKEFKDSIESYTKALDSSSKPEKSLWSLYYYRGISYERDKQWPLAEADFKKALKLFPDQPLVLNYLGYSWVDRGENLDEALTMLSRAVELRPNDGYIVDSLGWAHYKLGRYDEAMRELERAIDLKPSDPVINDHLGDAYWKVGRKLEAHFQWNHARDLKPEPDDLAKILKKIDHGLDDVPPPAEAVAEPKKSGG
jgi:tetratricopeptide (TPR) repeat protein